MMEPMSDAVGLREVNLAYDFFSSCHPCLCSLIR